MKKISEQKRKHLENLVDDQGIIGALAIDQRGALKRMMGKYKEVTAQEISDFKVLVSRCLTPETSGLAAAENRAQTSGLLLAYEKTGYDASTPGRLPDSLDVWSVKRLKEAGADACKFLLYYDVDESEAINERKKAYIERIGSECLAEEIPFFLEIVSYDANNSDSASKEYAKVKPHKVIEAMKEFSKDRYNVDVLKVEVPVNMNFVEGFGTESLYSQDEAQAFFNMQSEATQLPFIFLSAGVSATMFQETLKFAKKAGSSFNGVLCGRATWADGVLPFVQQGAEAAVAWLETTGKTNVEELNQVLRESAVSVFEKIQ